MVEGQSVSGPTGQPLEGVLLHLVPVSAQQGQAESRAAYQTTSAAGGVFTFRNVEPGHYLLHAERHGYARQRYGVRAGDVGGKVIRLRAGQTAKDLVVPMVPQSKLSGVILDEVGEPVRGAAVEALRVGYMLGTRQLLPAGMAASDADGRFVVGDLAPGRYCLRAGPAPQPLTLQERPTVRDGKVEEGHVATYYPNAPEPSTAEVLAVAAGSEIANLEVRMRKSRLFAIGGRVVDAAAGAPSVPVMLTLTEAGGEAGLYRSSRTTVVREDGGAFAFHRVPPGDYIIEPFVGRAVALTEDNQQRNLVTTSVGRLAVTVGREDIEGLVLHLGPGIAVRGVIRFDTDAEGSDSQPETAARTAVQHQATKPSRVRLTLQTADSFQARRIPAEFSGDRAFAFGRLLPGKYRLRVTNLPESTYVKSIRYGSQDVHDVFEISSGSGGLELTLSQAAAQVTGTVVDDEGKPLADLLVSLWPKATSADARADTTSTDENGAFRFERLAPGEYGLLAWEDIETGLAPSIAFCESFSSRAASVKLSERRQEKVELKPVGKQTIEAAAAALR